MIADEVLDGEVGEKRRHCDGGDAQDQESEEADQGRGDCGHGRDARRPKRFDELDQALHEHSPRGLRRDCAVHPAEIAVFMVSIRLIRRKPASENSGVGRNNRGGHSRYR